MSDIANRLAAIRNSLPGNVELLAVSKTHPVEALLEAYNAGQRLFGENKVQEMVQKRPQMPDDVQWHFIGHVQTNKIHLMAPFVSVIQGIDSYRALAETNRQAARFGRTITCLLQLHIAAEETKFGFTPRECMEMFEKGEWRTLEHVVIGGIMGMASNTDDKRQVLSEFQTLAGWFDTMKRRFFSDNPAFRTISAGMSGDYQLAVQAGSNMVRIGTQIFGARDYSI